MDDKRFQGFNKRNFDFLSSLKVQQSFLRLFFRDQFGNFRDQLAVFSNYVTGPRIAKIYDEILEEMMKREDESDKNQRVRVIY